MVFATGRVELLILLPKGNGKTTLFAALAVFHLLVVHNAECYIGAADKDQANTMYRFARHFVESSGLERVLKVRPATREIRHKRNLGFIQVIASDSSRAGGKRHSYNPTLALVDELHAHENDNLYVALRAGVFKRGGIILTISTAGYDHESTLGQVRARMLAIEAEGGKLQTGLVVNGEGNPEQGDGRLTIATTKTANTAMLEWALRPDDDLSDPQVVKLASPASFVTEASIIDAMEAPGITPWAFARYFCNVWTLGFESWLPSGAWEALSDPDATIEEGAEITAALDMARYRDCAALVWIDVETKVVRSRIWRSGGQDHPVPYGPVKDAIRELDETYRLTHMAYDPKYFDQAAEELEGEGIAMEKFPPSNERMCPATADLRKAIIDGEITHDGDSELTAHVIAAKAKDIGDDMFKLDKSAKNGPPIDGAEALSVAHRLALAGTPRWTGPLLEVFG